jgi:hypothetical protein
MKLVMTLLVRDEEDIVAAHIDYHLARGVDFIIAMDNLSEDRTPDILRGYERRGCLRYVHQPEDTYMQHRWVTGMARAAAAELGADWIINSDADEFWWPDDGDLKRVLAGVDPSAPAVVVDRTNFVPTRGTAPGCFAEAMTVRESRSLNALGAPLPGKVCHRAIPDIDVWQGNHRVLRHGQVLPAVRAPMTILHFPVRSYAQFANKIAKGGAAYGRNAELSPEVGNTWRQLYEVWRRGELERHYDALLLDDAAVEAGLRDGRLVRDDRLRTYLARLDGRRAGAE